MEIGGKAETITRTAPLELSVADLPLAPASGPARLEAMLRRAVLATAIGLSCLLGYLTAHALLALLALVALLAAVRVLRVELRPDPPGLLFLSVFALVTASVVATAVAPGDFVYLIYYSAPLLYMPMAALLRQGADVANSGRVADFALLGTATGLLVSLFYTYLMGMDRAGLNSGITDPIRLSNTALVLGFLAMMGMTGTKGGHRAIYLLGPVMALAVIFASASRSALIAFPVLLFVASLVLVRRKWLAALASLALLSGFAVIIYIADLAGARTSLSAFDVLGRLAAGDTAPDLGTAIRLVLYRAGTMTFLDSPLVGHGWANLMTSIVPHLAVYEQVHAQLPHLHNDALNFAVAGGIPGLAAYLLLLATPLLGCLFSPRDSQYLGRLYGCAVLTISYFVLGLPDAMLSSPLHLALYVVLTAILLGYCRDERA